MAKPHDSDGAERIWTWLYAADIALLVAQVIAAFLVGFFVVATWIARLWAAQSWWHLVLLSATSLFLLAGCLWEIRSRRFGPFGVFVVGFAILFGAHHLLNKST